VNSLHSTQIYGTYDYRLVALSIVLAIAASYAALDLAGRITLRRSRASWLVGGAAAMGLGIWAMHYVGMLAFRMPMPVLYDLPTVGWSLLAAVVASGIALHVVSRPTMGRRQEVFGSIAMGGGVAAMHYIGMAAMRMPGRIRYHHGLVALSVVLAMGISLVALILTFRARDERRASRGKIISAFVMGGAIAVVHYAGMAAARFSHSDEIPDLSHAISISSLGTIAIAAATLLILIFTNIAVFFDRSLAAQHASLEVARDSELQLRELIEAMPQMVWVTKADGGRGYVNQRWRDYTGLTSEQASGNGWEQVIHADDVEMCRRKWGECLGTGEIFEAEYRIRREHDGTYRWHLTRALPLRNPEGAVAKWFGTSTDIDDQKHSQEILEQEVSKRTEELTVANENLKREMWEREQVQSDLDQQNVAMVAEITRRSERTVLLSKMGKLLQSAINMDEAVAIILGFAPKIFPDFRGALMLLDEGRSLLEVKGTWADCKVSDSPMFDVGSCWALRTGQRHYVELGDRTAPCAHASTATDPYVCLPIMTHGGAAGVLHLQAIMDTREPFESEALITNSFVEQVAVSIATLKLQQALRQQSTKDALTGLYNRRFLEESLERELRRAARGGLPVGVVMFDLDHFKTFNDTFGHETGDAVLREMGACLSKNARAEDIPCRFGGEEFLLILPGADVEGARNRAERLRSQARGLAVKHQGQSVGTITVSVGVAAFPDHGSSVQELTAAADAALYQAKREGRDRVIVAEEPGSAQAAAGI
jgi:diguanylate cyclase (GGDEF)-like protein/PAS domain S-box-containing protein